MMNYNSFAPQMQRLNQLEQQQFQNYQQFTPQPQNRIFNVANEEVAKNTQINLDGSTYYFIYGDSILARTWNFASGSIENKTYKLSDDTNTQTEHKNGIQDILERLERIENKLTTKSKKELKDVE